MITTFVVDFLLDRNARCSRQNRWIMVAAVLSVSLPDPSEPSLVIKNGVALFLASSFLDPVNSDLSVIEDLIICGDRLSALIPSARFFVDTSPYAGSCPAADGCMFMIIVAAFVVADSVAVFCEG